MKLSLRWLARYVDLDDCSPEQVRDDLTMSTAEIEDLTTFGGGLEPLIVGHVVESARHPDADKLTVNRVDVGGETVQIICGAPNIARGQKVPVVLPGGVLPGGLKIKKAKIRGVESFGMICSERELGLSDEHEGIMVLNDSITPGIRFVDCVPVVDHVLEIDNKSVNHRPDLWGHYGFARELAAILDRPLRPLWGKGPPPDEVLPADGQRCPVEIESAADCPRFTTTVFENVPTQRSPNWLRWLLAAVEQRPINLAVDLTNFVMLEIGQPLHAFDSRHVDDGGIRVRRGREGEQMRTLDGADRALGPDDLLVTSADRPIAIAGIMGGEGSAIAEDSAAVILESANFKPALIRRTSARLGLRTDASARFEKSLDPAGAEVGARRFAQLLTELCPQARAAGPLVDPAGFAPEPVRIGLRRARCAAKLGVEVPDARIEAILRGLEFGLESTTEGWQVTVPTFRATKDVTIEDDLIEEVGRMFRYDNIPEQPLTSTVSVPPREPLLALTRDLMRLAASEMGFHEVYNYSFATDAILRAAGAEDHEYARLVNPVAPEATRIRRHVMPSLLSGIADNLRRTDEVRLVEQGKGYHPEHRDEHGLPREVCEIAFAWATTDGDPYPRLRSAIAGVLERLGFPVEMPDKFLGSGLPWVHPGRSTVLARGTPVVGYLSALHPAVARGFELPASTAIACVDLRALLATGRETPRYAPIARFPSQPVDVALLVDQEVRVQAVAEFLRGVLPKLVRDVALFEVYRGEGLPPRQKSLNFTVTLGAADRTLDARDEERYLARVREQAASVGATLRG